ncbi:MAG TPA: zinc ribbon domain-containing protein [Polyangiaceae bacterium]
MDNSQPTINCPKCGALGLADAHFCVHCGCAMRPAAAPASTGFSVARKTGDLGSSPRSSGGGPRPLPPPLISAKARKTARTQRMGGDPLLGREEAAPTSMAEAFASATGDVSVAVPAAVVQTAAPDYSTGNGAAPVEPAGPGATPPIHLTLDDIDSGFDAIVRPGTLAGAGPVSGERAEDMVEPRALFAQIAKTQTRPIRDFMVELQLGDASREWVRVCMPGVKSLRKSAQEMGLPELAKALDGYLAALELADTNESAVVSSAARDLLTGAYQDLALQLPGAFSLDEDGDRREPIIVQSLLAQISDVKKVALDKIYAAGLTSLSAFYVAKPSDIVEATGLPLELCQRIWERFQRYRRQISEMPPDADRTAEHNKLSELTTLLGNLNAAYEGRGVAVSAQTRDKKQIRQERTETMLEINVLMARLGEVRRVELLERLPFERKLEELERYLQAHNSKHRPF